MKPRSTASPSPPMGARSPRRATTAGWVCLRWVRNTVPRFFKAHEGRVASVAFDASGTRLLSAGNDERTARLWDLTSDPPALVQAFPKAQDKHLWATLSPDGEWMAEVGRSQVVDLYSTNDGQLVNQLVGHEQSVYRAEFSPNSRQLATVSWDATVRLWDVSSADELWTIQLPSRRAPPGPLWDFDFRCTPQRLLDRRSPDEGQAGAV